MPAARAPQAPTTRSDLTDTALRRAVMAATLLGAALRLFRLGHQSLWIDEQFTLAAAGVPGHLAWRDVLDNVHGPFYSLAVALAGALGGTAEWVLRLPSGLAGIAMVPAMAWLAGKWTGRSSVVPAAWLTAASPFLVWYSQEVRGYAFVMLAAVLATGLLLSLHERVRPGAVAGYVAASAAGVLSNFSFALLAPFHLWLWAQPGATRGARLKAVAITAVLVALAALPWARAAGSIWDWSRLAPERTAGAAEPALRGPASFHVAAVPFALHAFAMGYSGGPSLHELRVNPTAAVRAHVPELAVEGMLFGGLGVLGLLALRRRRRLLDLGLWLVAPALLVSYFAAHNFKVFHPRYFAVALPALLLLFAAAFADSGARARRAWGVAVALAWAVALGRGAFEPKYGKEDYRGAMAFVRSHVAPGDLVVATGAPEPVEWYGRGLPLRRFWLGHARDMTRLVVNWRDSLETWQQPRAVWVVASRTEDLDPGEHMRIFQDLLNTQPNERDFPGVRVWVPRGRIAPAR